jgi:hypothetical protein
MIIHNKFKNDGIYSKVEIELIISFNGKVHNLTLERINLRMVLMYLNMLIQSLLSFDISFFTVMMKN